MSDTKITETRRWQHHARNSRLTLIKILHTVAWAFFAACIVALPLAGLRRRFHWALVMTALVLLECIIIVANRGRCPLTDLAATLTDDRPDNFDIYLPMWLARYNKTIFGSLFIAGEVIVVWCWLKG
jgi:hypothetical protein